jgi:hypothetical protein
VEIRLDHEVLLLGLIISQQEALFRVAGGLLEGHDGHVQFLVCRIS